MALTSDDLQRLRDAIDKGWDFTMCHEIDFASAVSELVDQAMKGGESLAQKVLDEFPDSTLLRNPIESFKAIQTRRMEDSCYDCSADLESAIDDLEEAAEELDKAEREASSLL